MPRPFVLVLGFVVIAAGWACDPGGDPAVAPGCEEYCSTVQTCDATQFDQHFPSLSQCVTNCTYALSGDDPNTQPAACVEATRATVECVGGLTCEEFAGTSCESQHLAQETACP